MSILKRMMIFPAVALLFPCSRSLPGMASVVTGNNMAAESSSISNARAPVGQTTKIRVQDNYGKLPLYFIKNGSSG